LNFMLFSSEGSFGDRRRVAQGGRGTTFGTRYPRVSG
jgi:hypothetical protein